MSATFTVGQHVRHTFFGAEGVVIEPPAPYKHTVFVQCPGEKFQRSWMQDFVIDLATHLRAELARHEAEAAKLRARIAELEKETKP